MNKRIKKKYIRKYGEKFDWNAPIICAINTYGCGANIFNPTIKQRYRYVVEIRTGINFVKRVARNLDIYEAKRLKVKSSLLPEGPKDSITHPIINISNVTTGFVPGEVARGHRLTSPESYLLAVPDHYYEYDECLNVKPLNERAKKAVMKYEQENQKEMCTKKAW